MHSSGMCTAHLLTVSQHALDGGVYPSMHWAGGCLPGALSFLGVSAQGEGVWQTPQDQRRTSPPVDRQTHVKT